VSITRRVATKSPLGEAFAYIAKYWNGLKLFLTDGRIEIDNKTVERTIRPIALNRKNALFAGHDAGAENWATIASLLETCKLNAVDPLAYLTATLTAIVNGHRQSRIAELFALESFDLVADQEATVAGKMAAHEFMQPRCSVQ
jgi:transposase